ncbi:MAG: hypothetical protein EZS28_007186 [Streblomastix strix]|uniref:SPRY domain-containing protein n=1 Tax=Streblomastix strix TaxID=222440 RepID=A0A5J4WT51_9EUKA|nr:MAG: hypothetical protein EZS28_007186 [Streblomastix strix]
MQSECTSMSALDIIQKIKEFEENAKAQEEQVKLEKERADKLEIEVMKLKLENQQLKMELEVVKLRAENEQLKMGILSPHAEIQKPYPISQPPEKSPNAVEVSKSPSFGQQIKTASPDAVKSPGFDTTKSAASAASTKVELNLPKLLTAQNSKSDLRVDVMKQKPIQQPLQSKPTIQPIQPKQVITKTPIITPPVDPNAPGPIIPSEVDCYKKESKIIHTSLNSNICVVAYNPVLTSGVINFEGIFENTSNFCMIGIADSTVVFEPNVHPGQYKGKTLTYASSNGFLQHLSFPGLMGNCEFANKQRISCEVDMNSKPRRVHFFVDDIEQRNSVINIPPAIRFMICIYNPSSTFTLTKFDRLQHTSAHGVNRSKTMEWGKLWDND